MVQEDSLETEINVVAILFCAFALIVVGTRVLVRLRIVRAGWGWDDTTIVLALVSFWNHKFSTYSFKHLENWISLTGFPILVSRL